ncbi:AMP-binding protein [Micromonospora sp. NPDC126480]|uniref:AMP-binding protein n=1 Tax=Micromonospora sp. NPDC126480 TaxID=3155312 RepID=UPI00331FD870
MVDVSLADVLLTRAGETPDNVAYEFAEPAGPISTMTYAQLAGRASALAADLARCDDGPVLLACPAGLEYVVAVFAAFLAGRPVIPADAPPPSPRPGDTRLAGIIADARPPVALAPRPDSMPGVASVLTVPGTEADGTEWRRTRQPTGSDIAIVQYTSGSTSRPRGVLVRHSSLMANTAAITHSFGLTPASRGLTWLPPFHDMGLVGGLLTPMAAGVQTRILRPADFLKAPLWWLRQITETGADTTGGPNFAYDLCVRRAQRDDATDGLDLSRWRVAFNGGEPVNRATLDAFARRFAPAGFRAGSFVPCYGLAEATLIVSAGHWSPEAEGATVSCGRPVPGQQLAVVDLVRHESVADGVEGEIWLAGPHVTTGYLSGADDELFGELAGVRMLRTGDLGHLRAGELHVTGRAKDVIVFRGVNHHASDVERAALDKVGRAGGTAAAFGVETPAGVEAALVVEVRGERTPALAAQVRAAVLSRTRLPLGVVALVPPRSVPRTSSGKVRRSACRDMFLAGHLDQAVVHDQAGLAAHVTAGAEEPPAGGLVSVICGVVAAVGGADDVRPTDGLASLDVDSVQAAEAAAVLEDALGLPVPLETVLGAATPQDVADALVARWLADGHAPQLVRRRVDALAPSPG